MGRNVKSSDKISDLTISVFFEESLEENAQELRDYLINLNLENCYIHTDAINLKSDDLIAISFSKIEQSKDSNEQAIILLKEDIDEKALEELQKNLKLNNDKNKKGLPNVHFFLHSKEADSIKGEDGVKPYKPNRYFISEGLKQDVRSLLENKESSQSGKWRSLSQKVEERYKKNQLLFNLAFLALGIAIPLLLSHLFSEKDVPKRETMIPKEYTSHDTLVFSFGEVHKNFAGDFEWKFKPLEGHESFERKGKTVRLHRNDSDFSDFPKGLDFKKILYYVVKVLSFTRLFLFPLFLFRV